MVEKHSIGGVFLFLVILIGIYAFKKDEITSNLKQTQFFERVFGFTPQFIEKSSTIEDKPIIKSTRKKVKETVSNVRDQAEERVLSLTGDAIPQSQVAPQQESQGRLEEVYEVFKASFYYITIDSDGSVYRKIIKKNIPKTQTPLKDVLNILLEGPLEQGSITLIPKGTRLLSVTIRDGTAFLNLSEEFEFNPYGLEGSIGSLMQLVYTATEFSSVSKVQFLIEGEQKDYLNGELQWIGSPLNRNSF